MVRRDENLSAPVARGRPVASPRMRAECCWDYVATVTGMSQQQLVGPKTCRAHGWLASQTHAANAEANYMGAGSTPSGSTVRGHSLVVRAKFSSINCRYGVRLEKLGRKTLEH